MKTAVGNARFAITYYDAGSGLSLALRDPRDGENNTRDDRGSQRPGIGSSTINARADTVAVKPASRAAYKRRRCLVLADGYYEWLRVGKLKQPSLYEVDGGKPFALAGLWEQWWGTGDKDSPPLETCSLLTTEANELARKVHDRMPVILEPVDYDA